MQESMKDVHRRLQSLESKPQPLKQVSPSFMSRVEITSEVYSWFLSQLLLAWAP
jgi:hypothetical protein